MIPARADENNSPSFRRHDIQTGAVVSPKGITTVTAGQFDYCAKFALEDGSSVNRIVIGQDNVEIQFNLKICTGHGVEFVPNEHGHAVPGFRLYSVDMSSVVYEGRIIKERINLFPDQWIPFTLTLPGGVVRSVRSAVLVFDLVNEGQFWFAQRGGPEYRFLLEFVDNQETSSYPDVVGPPEPSAAELPSPRETRNAGERLAPAGSDIAETVQGSISMSAKLAEGVVPQATSAPSALAIDAPRAASRAESRSPSSACLFDANSKSPERRPAANGTSPSALSQCFRMKVSLIDAEPADFRIHCYRSLLRRDPEPDVTARPIAFANIGARIAYWKAILLSREFGADESVPPRDEITLRIIESLGWSAANTLLGYALRIESMLSGTFRQFVGRISESLVRNSFSSPMIGEVCGIEESGRDYSLLFEGLVDLAVEFSVGLSRLDEMWLQVEDMRRRAEDSLNPAGRDSVRSEIAGKRIVDEALAAHGSSAAAALGERTTETSSSDHVASLFATFPRRQPTRWAPL